MVVFISESGTLRSSEQALGTSGSWRVPKDECTAEISERRDCKESNEESCETKGCCWRPIDNNPHNLPWCFHKAPEPQCQVPEDSREDCAGDESSCEAKGCCWQPMIPNSRGRPWCFKPSTHLESISGARINSCWGAMILV